MIKTIIVDDEPFARQRIRSLLQKETDIEIIEECENGRDAVEAINRLHPDLIFLDIQMPELDGFGVLRELSSPLPAVVFVTAYDTYAVKAFEFHALDYLLKPFKPTRLKESLDRVRKQLSDPGQDSDAKRILALLDEHQKNQSSSITRIAVRTGDRIRFVPVADVDWVEASGNYIILHSGEEKHMIRETLGSLESKLSPKQFSRISRSAIINLDRVKEIQPTFNNEHVVVLKNGARIPMTRSLRELQEKLSTI